MKKFNEISGGKKALRIILLILLALLLVVIVYVSYVFLSYHRISDWHTLNIDKSKVAAINAAKKASSSNANKSSSEGTTDSSSAISENDSTDVLSSDTSYKAITYNTGFSAYLPDFDFFMDGGTQSWAKSKESVIETTKKIAYYMKDQNADFISLQEVDCNSTRTYGVDEVSMIRDTLEDYSNVTACCFDCPFLFWPVYQPHGKNTSNLMSLSKYNPTESLRRQFPVDEGLTKIMDYDRCYSKTRYKTDTGKDFILYTTHMSAYSKDPSTSNKQIQQIVADMQEEYEQGNYCLCSADFNKQIVDNPENYMDPNLVKETKPFPKEYLEGTSIKLTSPLHTDNYKAGTCRYAGAPLTDSTPVSIIDGFLISANIKVNDADILDNHYEYSDHNAVYLNFSLSK